LARSTTVGHLPSNPDIARAATEPEVDFYQGTVLTNNVVEAMRLTGARRILYASGSGVYGDLGVHEVHEDHGPLLPISTYGASKLAGEALIAYKHDYLSGTLREKLFGYSRLSPSHPAAAHRQPAGNCRQSR
jgi:nucleoside-diphosphate-sugar epimerase